jgi:UDPglucose 6-dehydrogenase
MKEAFVIGGLGIVGQATTKSLGVTKYFDTKKSNITLKQGAKMKYCFICLPTPTDEKGGQTEARKVIHDYIAQLTDLGFKGLFIIRSTVIPGTCKALAEEFKCRVASCPETLSEDSWEQDAVTPKVIIMGGDTQADKEELASMWKDVKTHDWILTDTVTAETIKYAFNSFFLTKIVWANQMYDICEKNGADYEKVKHAIKNHRWGTTHHLIIEHKGGRGGGGRCLPKDIKAWAKYSGMEFFKLIDELNDAYLTKSKKK